MTPTPMWHKALGRAPDRTIAHNFGLPLSRVNRERTRRGIPAYRPCSGRPVSPSSLCIRAIAYVEEHGPVRARDVADAIAEGGVCSGRNRVYSALTSAVNTGRLTRLAPGLYDRVGVAS